MIRFRDWVPIFLPYEKAVLCAIESHLSIDAQNIFHKQISLINKVQRLSKNKEVNLYRKKGWKIHFDDTLRFPLDLPEVKLGKVKIKFKDDSNQTHKIINAEIWLVEGHIFSITFNISPLPYLKNSFDIVRVEILEDPMQKTIVSTIDEIENSFIYAWIKQNFPNVKIEEIFSPLLPERINKKLKEFDCKFPDDWLELLNYCDGFKLDKCSVYGLHDVRQVTTDENQLIIITEGFGSKMLTINRDKKDGIIYYIDLAIDTFEFIDYGNSFRVALGRYLNS